jgi:hypothetical protein
MGNVIAFPGVTLTARDMGPEPPRPPRSVTSTPCPVCAAPVWSEDPEFIGCTRCHAKYHALCFWRALPISEWVAWLAWIDERRGRSWIGGTTSAQHVGS